ncbi:MAG: DUF1657 domain-containing protein [Bacillota bacterium]|nr:DUF1657 domain-containing protein [Bacillota bacterium]MDW7684572.1 DUF1657 domain-containing protein [Bacillota bacterium]
MTVATQIQQAIATAKGAQASFETFAQQTKDEAVKQMYADAAGQLQAVIEGLEKRMEQIRQEEPQY